MEVIFVHESPPIPSRGHEWRAYFDAEDGRDGFGETKLKAALDLWGQVSTSEGMADELLACIVAILRADQEQMIAEIEKGFPASYVNAARIAYMRAITTVEGIE